MSTVSKASTFEVEIPCIIAKRQSTEGHRYDLFPCEHSDKYNNRRRVLKFGAYSNDTDETLSSTSANMQYPVEMQDYRWGRYRDSIRIAEMYPHCELGVPAGVSQVDSKRNLGAYNATQAKWDVEEAESWVPTCDKCQPVTFTFTLRDRYGGWGTLPNRSGREGNLPQSRSSLNDTRETLQSIISGGESGVGGLDLDELEL
jgi:hypothetical protein